MSGDDSSGEGWVQRLPSQEGFEGSQEGMAQFAQGRPIPAEAAERRSAAVCPKAAENLLLPAEHPQVALGLIVVEGNRQVIQEGPHFLAPQPETLKENRHRQVSLAVDELDVARARC